MAMMLKISKVIENQIDEYLDIISESGLVFKKAVEYYLKGNISEYDSRMAQVIEYERKGDELRQAVEHQLYLRTLIPENRGDVLAILENTDDVIDSMKDALMNFTIELPEIPEQLHNHFNELTEASINSVEWLVRSIRAFFKDVKSVNDYVHKVSFYEKEADNIAAKLKIMIYREKFDLSHKNQLRYFAQNIEQISDGAEAVGDRITIYTIKRLI